MMDKLDLKLKLTFGYFYRNNLHIRFELARHHGSLAADSRSTIPARTQDGNRCSIRIVEIWSDTDSFGPDEFFNALIESIPGMLDSLGLSPLAESDLHDYVRGNSQTLLGSSLLDPPPAS